MAGLGQNHRFSPVIIIPSKVRVSKVSQVTNTCATANGFCIGAAFVMFLMRTRSKIVQMQIDLL